jgi:hypothetical protein
VTTTASAFDTDADERVKQFLSAAPSVDGTSHWKTALEGLESDNIRNQFGEVYMDRFYPTGDKSLRFHHILESDSDRDLHDHPWDFVSLILEGRYHETTEDGTTIEYGEGDLLIRQAETLHRLTLDDGPVWTYVVTGPVRRRWGFQTEYGWVHWRDYLDAV